MKVVVVGGGVAGLATAHRLLEADPALDVTVLESEPVVGGRLRTAAVGDLSSRAARTRSSPASRGRWTCAASSGSSCSNPEPATP